MKCLTVLLVAMLVVWGLASPLAVQGQSDELPPISLTFGRMVTGSIDDEHLDDEWVFEAQAGEIISIEMLRTTGDLDPYLRLTDASGAKLAADDDNGTGLNSLISGFEVPASGPYVVVAGRSISGNGTYALLVTRGERDAEPGPGNEAGGPGGPVAVYQGADLSGYLDDDHPEDYWTFYAAAGDTLTFSMARASGDLDPYLALHAVDRFVGAELAWDNDGGEGDNARLADFTVPSTGVYLIAAGRFGANAGDYVLQITSAQAQTETPNTTDDLTLSYGSVAFGSLGESQPAERWTFEGTRGDQVMILMDTFSDDLDPELILLSPTRAELARDEDSGEAFNAWIYGFTLPVSGTYTIQAVNSTPFGTQDAVYRLALYRAGEQPPAGSGEYQPWEGPGAITYGQLRSGGVDANDWEDVWFFSGTWDDAIEITLQPISGRLNDLFIELYTIEGKLVTLEYGSEVVNESLALTAVLPRTGDYYVNVGTVNLADAAGSYDLTLVQMRDNPTPASPIDYGDTVTGTIDPTNRVDGWYFEGQGGQGIVINAARRSGNLSLAIELVDADNTVLAYATDAEGTGLPPTIRKVLPSDGTYLIRVEYMVQSEGEYELSLLKQAPQQEAAQPENSEPTPEPEAADAADNGSSADTNGNGAEAAAAPTEANAGQIAYGQTVKGTINDASFQYFWDFEGTAGDVVIITMDRASGNLNGQLYVFDPTGAEMTYLENWLGSDDWGARAVVQLAVSGTYSIAATRVDYATGHTSGDYALTLLRVANEGNRDETSAGQASEPGAESMADTHTVLDVTGTLGPESPQEWSFEGRAREVVLVTVNRLSGDLVPTVSLIDAGHVHLRDSSDCALYEQHGLHPEGSACIEDVLLHDNASYYIEVGGCMSWSGMECTQMTTGDYLLSVIALPRRLTYDTTVGEALYATNEIDHWTFEGRTGDIISLIMEPLSGDLRPTLELFSENDSAGNYLTSSEGFEDGTARIIDYVLPHDGLYVVWATSFPVVVDGEYVATLGDYRLTLRRAVPAGN